jgi:predicted MFS family arabinose efflux permease
MSEEPAVTAAVDIDQRDPWKAMAIIGLGQGLMTFNVSALPISISGIVGSFHVVPTTVGTAIVVYSLCVAAFVMLGAKLGQIYGSRNVFRVMSAACAVAMVMMTFAPDILVVLVAQAIAGLAASAGVPSLVVLIANNYKGRQQSQALGLLGGINALAAMLAFFVAGTLETLATWRFTFAILIPWSIALVFLGRHLAPVDKVPGIKIDLLGVVLSASAIIFISFGFNNLNHWGVLLAKPAALFQLGDLSPAPVMIVLGLVLVQSFLVWSHRRAASGKTPLLALQVIESPQERVAVLAMLIIVVLGNALTFLMPLYIEIIQGRSSFRTAVYLLPYQLAVFAAAVLVVRLYGTLSPRQIARYSFVVVAIGFISLGIKFRNEWSDLLVILFLIVIGVGQGALVTLLFNVLVTASPKQFAGDVGSLRGTTSNLAAAVGTAVAGALMVGILSLNIERSLIDHPTLPSELTKQVDLNNVTFISNDHLIDALARTTATPEQVKEAVHINADARLRALRLSLFFLAGLAFLVIIPAGGLPNYVLGQVPRGHPEVPAEPGNK